VGRERTVRRTSPAQVIDGLTGSAIVSADRRGKYLLFPLDSGDTLMVHLRMSGQLLLASPDAALAPHTHVRISFDDAGDELRFVDPRTFGEVVVFDPDHVDVELPELARLGPDPITDGLTRRELRQILRGRRRGLKALLLDQHVIAGIGNIYADEILHAARIRPERASDTLSSAAEARLHDSMFAVLDAAIEAGGSTLRDAQYVDADGIGGAYQHEHRVYGRGGERCVTCGRGIVRRIVVGQRSTHFCPVCQH
jgi:formamidopyrimidine-DNA glycosylase